MWRRGALAAGGLAVAQGLSALANGRRGSARAARCFDQRLEIAYDHDTQLGQGSFSRVFRGRDVRAAQPVALKIMNKHFTQVAFDEITSLLRIKEHGSHPNIVEFKGIVDIEGHSDQLGLVFELLEGGELYEHLVQHGAYSEHRAAEICAQTAHALAFLHGIGLAHGDLKPENLVLAKDGTVKLCDFGSCVALDGPNGTFGLAGRRPVGTVAYAAPELLVPATAESRASGKVDVWSLGIVLFVMLSGSNPFDSDNELVTDEELAPLCIKGEFDFEAPVWKEITPACKELIRLMIEPDQEKRISAKAILEHPWVVYGGNRQALAGSDVRLKGFMRTQRVLQDLLFKRMLDGSLKAGDGGGDKEALERFWRTVDTEGKGFITAADLSLSPEPSTQQQQQQQATAEERVFYKSLNGLVGLGERLSLGPGVSIFEAGDAADSMYFVDKGKVQIVLGGNVVKTMGAGDFFGETALLRNKPRNASVRTQTACELVRFSRDDFNKLAARDAQVNQALKDRVAQRSVEHLKAVYSFLFHDAQTVHLGKGGVLLKKGDPSNDMFFIDEGVVDVVNSAGRVVSQRGEGTTVGELGLVTGEPRSMTIRCAAEHGCAFKRLTREDLDRLVSFSPDAESELRSSIAGRQAADAPRRSLTRLSQGTAR